MSKHSTPKMTTIAYHLPTRLFLSVAYPPGGQGDGSPRFQADGTVMQKSPHFLTQNDAIAGFTSQSLGLLAYACKTDSSKLPECTKTCHLRSENENKIWGGAEPPLQTLTRWGGWTPPPTPNPRRLVPRARHVSSPTY